MLRIGIVGAGKIVPYHLEVLMDVGFQPSILLYRNNLNRAKEIANRFKIGRVTDSISDFLEEKVDAYLIASSAESLDTIYKKLRGLGTPILIEKPVSHSREFIETSVEYSNLTQVGYNRRMISTVTKMKEFVIEKKEGIFFLNLYELPIGYQGIYEIRNILLNNTVHAFDLINFLFDIKCEDIIIDQVLSQNKSSHSIIGRAHKNFSGVIAVNFGIPGNYRLEVVSRGERAILEPFEKFTRFKGMTIHEPESVQKQRMYLPTIIDDSEINGVDVRYKAGFYRQAEVFADLCRLKTFSCQDISIPANLHDALSATRTSYKFYDALLVDSKNN